MKSKGTALYYWYIYSNGLQKVNNVENKGNAIKYLNKMVFFTFNLHMVQNTLVKYTFEMQNFSPVMLILNRKQTSGEYLEMGQENDTFGN